MIEMTHEVTPKKRDLGSSRLRGMNFLNEVSSTYPQAISFASGRPAEQFFRVEEWLGQINAYVGHRAGSGDRHGTRNLLAQYGRTNGIIGELVARQVLADESIACQGDSIVTTAGCQEAIALCLGVLCRDENDVVLVRSPTYIGLTGAADLHGVALAPLVCPAFDELPDALEHEVRRLRRLGKRPRAIYVIPDFDNPTGSVLGIGARERLLSLCAREEILIIEDNPYGMFRYEGERLPPLAALDRAGCTLYLGTYSKTLCPAVRVGFIVVPKTLFGRADEAERLIERISIAKSFVTCNTSQFTQAIVAGVLLAEGGSLARMVEPARAHYGKNLRHMVDSLKATLGARGDRVRWSHPSGGFFLTVDMPFRFKEEEVKLCAAQGGVVVMPMSFFALTDDADRSVRLAFSNVSFDQIERGVGRFADFVKSRI